MSINDLLAELQNEYIKTLPEKIRNIELYWQEQNLEALENEFHKIKGTGKSYGLPEVTILGEAMERVCQADPASLNELVTQTVACMQKIFDNRSQGAVPDLQNWPEFTAIQAKRGQLG